MVEDAARLDYIKEKVAKRRIFFTCRMREEHSNLCHVLMVQSWYSRNWKSLDATSDVSITFC